MNKEKKKNHQLEKKNTKSEIKDNPIYIFICLIQRQTK